MARWEQTAASVDEIFITVSIKIKAKEAIDKQ